MALVAAAAAAQEPQGVSPLHGSRMVAGLAVAPVSGARINRMFDNGAARQALVGPEAPIRLPEKGSSATPPMSDPRLIITHLHQDLVVPVPVASRAYRRTFRTLLAHPDKTDRYDELIIKYARLYRLDARFLKSIMAAESEFDSQALSPAGARGLMQVMPRTAEEIGVSAGRLYDPEYAVKAGAAYIQLLFKAAWRLFHLKGVRYTDVPYWVMQRVVAAYHAGPKFLTRSHWFAATRAYVRKVVLYYQSKVTDMRRPAQTTRALPSFADAVVSGGTLY